jgi:PIN domain nuclease of toxin-antitoxin system
VRLLLDTHTLLWSVDDPSKISARAMAAMIDPGNERFVSAVTIWELAIKQGQGKITLSPGLRPWLDGSIADLGLSILPITVTYAERYAVLPAHHKDPFDRMLIAQALVDGLAVVGVDAAFDAYGVTRIW